MIDFMSCFVVATLYSCGGRGTDNNLWFFFVFFFGLWLFTLGKKIPLDTLDIVFLFFSLGTRNCLHMRTCYIHATAILATFSQFGGHLVFFRSLAQGPSGGGRGGGQRGMIQKGLFYWTILEVVGFFFSRQGDLWNDLVYSSIYIWDAPVGPRRNHSSSLLDIFRVEEVVFYLSLLRLSIYEAHS